MADDGEWFSEPFPAGLPDLINNRHFLRVWDPLSSLGFGGLALARSPLVRTARPLLHRCFSFFSVFCFFLPRYFVYRRRCVSSTRRTDFIGAIKQRFIVPDVFHLTRDSPPQTFFTFNPAPSRGNTLLRTGTTKSASSCSGE